MGYTITYQQTKKQRHTARRRRFRAALTGVFLICFLLVTYLFWPDGRAYLQSILIPGDAAVTVAALEDFSQSLKSGISFSESFSEFCLRVLEGAGFAAN